MCCGSQCKTLDQFNFPLCFYCIFIGHRLNTGGTYRIGFVCSFVHPSVTAFLKNRSKDFSETWYEVRTPYGLENSVDLFLYILLILLKSTFFALFWPFFGSFLDFMKTRL